MSAPSRRILPLLLLFAWLGAGTTDSIKAQQVETPAGEPAEKPDEEDVYRGPEVVVEGERIGRTGMKQDLPLKKIPATVNVIDEKQLKEQAADQWNSALRYTPGVYAHQNYGGFNTATLRGMDSRNLLLLRDGVRDETFLLVNSQPMSTLGNVERIEVLKGPNSVLYGQGAMAGVINIIRKKPRRTAGFDFTAAGGSYGNRKAFAGATGPLGTERIRYRADAGTSQYEGWRQNGYRQSNGFLTVEVDLTEDWTLAITGGQTSDRYDTDAGLPTGVNPNEYLVEPGVARENNYNSDADFLVNQRSEYRLELEGDITDSLGMRARVAEIPMTYNYFAVESLSLSEQEENVFERDENIIQRDHFHFETRRKPFQGTLEFDWKFKAFIEHDLLFGAEHHSVVDRRKRRYFPLGTTEVFLYAPDVHPLLVRENPSQDEIDRVLEANEVRFTNQTKLSQKMNSFYAQDLMEVTDRLKLVVGLRQDYWFRETESRQLYKYHDKLIDAEAEIEAFEDADAEDIYFNRVGLTNVTEATVNTYRTGAVYDLTDYYTVYVGHGSSFTPVTVLDIQRRKIEPERGQQIEIGQRIELLDGKITIDNALFRADKWDVVVLISDTPELYDQGGRLRTQGYELDITMNLFEGWDLRAGYAHTQVRWTKFSTVIDSVEVDLSGNVPRNVPADTASLWTTYRFKNGFGLGAGGRYIGSVYANNFNTYSLPGYAAYDWSLFWEGEHIEVRFNVTNASNKEHFVSATPNPTPGPPTEALFTVSGKF